MEGLFRKCENAIPRELPYMYLSKSRAKVYIPNPADCTIPFLLAGKVIEDGPKRMNEVTNYKHPAPMALDSYNDKYRHVIDCGATVCENHCDGCVEIWEKITTREFIIDERSDYIDRITELHTGATEGGLHCFEEILEKYFPKRYEMLTYTDEYTKCKNDIETAIDDNVIQEENYFFAMEYWDEEQQMLQYFTHKVTLYEYDEDDEYLDEQGHDSLIEQIEFLSDYLQKGQEDLYNTD